MISAQSFFTFSDKRELLVIPLVDVTLSYHFPIAFYIEWHIAQPRPTTTQFYLNMSVLHHQPTIAHILQIQNLVPRSHQPTSWIKWWNDAITRSAWFLRIYGRQLARFFQRSYEATTKALYTASEALVLDPFNMYLQLQLAQLQQHKQITENYTAQSARIKARLHWLKVGDRAFKEFFLSLRAHHNVTDIKKN